jgi:hypothetical protein
VGVPVGPAVGASDGGVVIDGSGVGVPDGAYSVVGM